MRGAGLCLTMFLWTVGAPQSIRQVENRFERSTETINKKVQSCVELFEQIGRRQYQTKNPHFSMVHSRLQEAHFSPHFMVSLEQ
jgi:hypothetical protein